MTATERCDLTELLASDCAHCRGIPDPPRRQLGWAFKAEYDGRCSDCDEPFTAGARIRHDGDGYVGPCCTDDHAEAFHDR